jgi:phosphoenolpyruvate carboxykinase (GTP)
VLKWCVERIEGRGAAVETPVGHVPTPDQIDLDGLDADLDDVAAALAVDADEWREEIPLIEEWFARIGDKLPSSMRDELEALKLRLGM